MNGKSKQFSMKLKLCVGLLVTVAAAMAVVCFVSFNHPVKSEPNESRASHKRSLELEHETNSFTASDLEVVHRQRRQSPLVRGGTSSQHRLPNDIDCYSINNTIPAAHIKGRGRFAKPTGSTLVPGYQQEWICSDIDPKHPHHPIHAFVDGGMSFRHKYNRIYVPTCGYYHISSQILFESNAPNRNGHAQVSHLLKFIRNCSWTEDNAQLVMGVSSIHPGNTTTTFTSDVVKLCKGGSVWVEIHETHDDDVYPLGDNHATFITAVLVAKTSCHWPPTTIMENSDHSHD